MYKILDNKIVYMLDDKIKGEVCFKIRNNEASIYHTYVDEDLRGKGVAFKLVSMAFDYLEENNYQVECSCSYAKNWALKHGKGIINS